jgi:arginine-tRNA-protein transferase
MTFLATAPYSDSLVPAHKFTLDLDQDTFTQEKYNLYLRYQQAIHRESKHENNPEQFKRFLCSSPLHRTTFLDPHTGVTRQTGSFHHLYRIDDELIAFAVLDFLPNTISSVYFVYDPDKMRRFGMGKVSAVREVAMCVEMGYKYYGLGTQRMRINLRVICLWMRKVTVQI